MFSTKMPHFRCILSVYSIIFILTVPLSEWPGFPSYCSPHISLEPERCFVFVLIAAARVRTLRRKEKQGSRCAPCSILLLPSSSPPLGIYCTIFVPFLLPSAASVWRLEIRKNMPYFSVISFCTSERRRWCSWGPRS